MKPKATYIIATYARADALEATLVSLMKQDCTSWEAIVVGDNCDAETEQAIRSISDFRIRYYNLPLRCGEQSIPNSFGLLLAEGEFVCFLNHDDVLFGDALSHQLVVMEEQNADMLFSRFGVVSEMKESGEQVLPVVSLVLPAIRSTPMLFSPNSIGLDPSSFWLVRADFAKKVGVWRPANEIHRFPIGHWLARAGRLNPKIYFDQQIAGLQFLTQYASSEHRRGVPAYLSRSFAHQAMKELLITYHYTELRDMLALGELIPHDLPFSFWYRLQVTFGAWLYQTTNIDCFEVKYLILGRKRGASMSDVSIRRVGKSLGRATMDQILRLDPESIRVV